MAEAGEHTALLGIEAAAHQDVQQLAKVPLADKARSQKLSAAIQDKLARIRALTRDLELEVEEMDSEDEERAEAASQLAQHKSEYARLQAALKEAALAQRAAALRSAQEERKELLAGGKAALRQRRAQAQGDVVAAAEDVTGGLRRTRQVLAEELEHTSATLAAMEASHTALGRTRDEYHGQHRKLRQSKGLLGTLNWQAKSETYMLWMGLTVFLAVCAYVVQKRAGHFIPDRLKPSALLGSLTGGAARVGRQPVSAPAPSVRLRAQVPPHGVHHPGAGGGGRAPQQVHHQAPPPLAPQPVYDAPPGGKGSGWEEEGEWAAEGDWPAPAPPYGGFAHEGEEEEVQDLPTYGPPPPIRGGLEEQEPAVVQLEEQQQEQPAEWPAGSPEPLHGQQQGAEAAGLEQDGGEGEQGEALGEHHEPAEWPTGSLEPPEQHQAEVDAQAADAAGEAAQLAAALAEEAQPAEPELEQTQPAPEKQQPQQQEKQGREGELAGEQLQQHDPAEWPSGSPEPRGEQHEEGAAAEADVEGLGVAAEMGQQQQQGLAGELEEHAPAEWPTGSPEPPREPPQEAAAAEEKGGQASELEREQQAAASVAAEQAAHGEALPAELRQEAEQGPDHADALATQQAGQAGLGRSEGGLPEGQPAAGAEAAAGGQQAGKAHDDAAAAVQVEQLAGPAASEEQPAAEQVPQLETPPLPAIEDPPLPVAGGEQAAQAEGAGAAAQSQTAGDKVQQQQQQQQQQTEGLQPQQQSGEQPAAESMEQAVKAALRDEL